MPKRTLSQDRAFFWIIQTFYIVLKQISDSTDTIEKESGKRGKNMSKNVYMNRELSWLKFNERVLEEAENPDVPLCERLSFVSIYQSNLDEFFMVRVGSLIDQQLLSREIRENKTNLTPKEQIKAVLKQVRLMNERKDRCYQELLSSLRDYQIHIVDFKNITGEEREFLENYFDREVAPLLSPTIVGRRQPFPFLRNREIYAAGVLETKSGREKIGIIPCGKGIFPKVIEIPSRKRYLLPEELILHFLPKVFKGYKVSSKSLIRITRNADMDMDALYDEDLNYREFMEKLIKKRKKLAPVRMELSRQIKESAQKMLCEYLKLDERYVYRSGAPLDMSFVSSIRDILRKETKLFYEKRVPRPSVLFEDSRPVLDQIGERDKLLSYPYESMKPFLKMLYEAANDEKVISIKMTLYRLAKGSKIVEALVEAAENGKQVHVLVELKARFDEENNIEWSRKLEDAGCRVIYGLDGYKVHSKLCLITRKTEGEIQYITQIGTGNYNEKTSTLYTDLSLMTANKEIGMEAASIFQALEKGETLKESRHLMVAPDCLQDRVIDMIQSEIDVTVSGREGYIGLKLNSLTDKKIIDKLIEASKAGVKIDMIIRGICCLIPGISGETENIRVISIVGRYLEHSRIYIFGTEERERIYISSADYMTRNTVRRVEVAAPVWDCELKTRIHQMFEIMLRDNQKARLEDENGNYRAVKSTGDLVCAQDIL